MIAFGKKVENLTEKGIAGDIDVATKDELIEVKKSIKAVHLDQLDKYVDSSCTKYFNYERKNPILYIDESIDMSNKYNVKLLEQIK